MELKDIFRMEMFKNWHDRPYLIVIVILTIMAALATFLGIAMIEGVIAATGGWLALLIPLIIFFALSAWVFSLLYPFHLLNVDYKNRVMSLIFASGVSREKYYFVKISATILTCLAAMVVVVFIPVIAFLVVYPEVFVKPFQLLFSEFGTEHILPFALSSFLGALASVIILTTSVIITKGRVAGIFLYFGFVFALSTIQSTTFMPMMMKSMYLESAAMNMISTMMNWQIVGYALQAVGFVFLGLWVLRRQDL